MQITVYIYSMKLVDLIKHFELYGVCINCRRMEQLDIASMVAAGGSQLDVKTIRTRVRCRRCGLRTCDIRIVYSGPCGHARGFHYRD
jgi:ribosomal protein L37E